jgi:hypothetical protein
VKGGLIYLSFQTLVILFIRTYVSNRRREDKVRLMHLEQYMYEEREEKRSSVPETSRSSLIESRCELIPKGTEWMNQEEEFARRYGGCLQRLKVKVMKNVNLMRHRRFTTDLDGKALGATITCMHKENIRRLKNAYKHPFNKIPPEYFEFKLH